MTSDRAVVAYQSFGIRRSAVLMIMLAAPLMAPGSVRTSPSPDEPQRDSYQSPVLILPDETIPAVLYADGSRIMTKWETVWRPMCGDQPARLSIADLQTIAQAEKADPLDWEGHAAGVGARGGDPEPEVETGGLASGGLHITFETGSSVPAAAFSALARAKSYLQSLFADPISISVTVRFMGIQPGVLGATSAKYTNISWNQTRQALRSDMDSNDTIQADLPTSSTIPVRYNGSSALVTDETRVFWTRANFKAAVGAVAGSDASMIFNSSMSWDFDPSNGVTGYSFEDVLIHEMAHVLGFSSGIDSRSHDIEVMDIFRFQRTAVGTYNPRNAEEFKHFPRLVSYNKPNDDHCCDLLAHEYRMADGSPYQASHFRYQYPAIGLMAPVIVQGQTRFPHFFSQADLEVLDAIGYDR